LDTKLIPKAKLGEKIPPLTQREMVNSRWYFASGEENKKEGRGKREGAHHNQLEKRNECETDLTKVEPKR